MTRRPSTLAFVVIGVVVAVALVIVVAPNANPNPDGLAKVAADQGLDSGEQAHALDDGPFAGYGVRGVDNNVLATGAAGIVGIAVTFLIGAGIVVIVRRTRRRPEPAAPGAAA